MYILKNAWKSITRSKGRNLLIGILVAVIAASSCIALSIQRAAQKAKTEGLDSLRITAQISVDRQALMEQVRESGESADRGAMMEAMQGAQELTLEELQTYAQSEYLEGFTYTMSSSLNGSGELEAVDTSGSESETSENSSSGADPAAGQGPGFDNGGKEPPGGMGSQGDFTLVGYSSYNAMTDFTDGVSKITSGQVFDESASELVCIIHQDLATLNSLEVGDTITLENPNQEDETYSVKIVGIYEKESSDSAQGPGQMRGFSAASDPANQIYTSYQALKSIVDQSEASAETSTDSQTGMERTTALRSQVTGTYLLADAEAYEAFEQDVRDMGLPEEYTVSSSDLTQYKQSLLPLENLSRFSSYFLIVVLLIGAVILIVFNIFNIRERKYEVGVLTSIGMKKGKVALQFVLELFCVTLIAILIGSAAGAAGSAPVANQLLQAQTASQQEQVQQRNENFGRPDGMGMGGSAPDNQEAKELPSGGFGGQVADYVTQINANVDWVVLLEMMGIGIGLTLLSSCAAVVFILRYEPLKILANRS